MTVHTAESMIHCSSAPKLNNLGQFSPVYFSSEPLAVGIEELSVILHKCSSLPDKFFLMTEEHDHNFTGFRLTLYNTFI